MPLRRVKRGPLSGPDDAWEDSGDESNSPPPTTEEEISATQQLEEIELEKTPPNDADVVPAGESDETMGMTPARRLKEVSHKAPPQRGRHVGAAALALVSRIPLVGLRYLRDSREFVIYDDQPPPSGEYVVQTLGISTLEYDGVQQNHLLVTFKAGQLTGFGMEDNYYAVEYALVGANVDFPVNVQTLLGGRDGRTLVVNYNRNISIKVNTVTATPFSLAATQSPYVIDLGLNISSVYISTTKSCTVRLEAW